MDKDKSLSNEVKRQRERSTAYPGIGLGESVELVFKLREKLGQGPHKRSAAAVGIGYSGLSGASARKIAAMTHFGLLDRTGDRYTVSILANRILFPISNEDKEMAIIEAAKQPNLYSLLLSKYSGEKLPAMLQNVLRADYGISPTAAPEAVAAFVETMKFSRLLDENGILSSFMNATKEISANENTNTESLQSPASSQINQTGEYGHQRLLQGANWKIVIDSKFGLTKEIKTALRALEDAFDESSANLSNENLS